MGDEYGVTGMCIILEEVAHGAAIAVDFYETTVNGYSPIVRFGSESRKKQWLPPLASGEHFACIAITEPFMGSDAAAIQTTMVEDGDEYLINGKKRFITVGGVGTLYCTYVKTSDDPEDIANYRHLSAVFGADAAIHSATGKSPERTGNSSRDSAPRNTYLTSDGQWLAMSGSMQSMAMRIFSAIGRADMCDDPRYNTPEARTANYEEVDQIVTDFISERSLEDCMALLKKKKK